MAPARNRTIALLVTLLVAASGCSRAGSEQGPTAPLATAEPSEAASPEPTETASPDPYAIPEDPDDIDAAYVERVLEALSVSIADATAVVVREGQVTREVRSILAATHRAPALPGVIDAFRQALRTGPARRFFRRNPTPARIEVRQVISRGTECLFTRVRQDTSGLGRKDIEPFPAYYHLEAKRQSDDPAGRNPTPWMIVADGEPLPGGKEYADPCT